MEKTQEYISPTSVGTNKMVSRAVFISLALFCIRATLFISSMVLLQTTSQVVSTWVPSFLQGLLVKAVVRCGKFPFLHFVAIIFRRPGYYLLQVSILLYEPG